MKIFSILLLSLFLSGCVVHTQSHSTVYRTYPSYYNPKPQIVCYNKWNGYRYYRYCR